MGYVDRTLRKGEVVIVRARLHWIIYAPAIAMIILGVVVLLIGDDFRIFGVMPIAGAIFLAGSAWLYRLTTEIAATSRRFIVKRGMLRRNIIEIQAWQIESVTIDQSMWGRMLNFGTLIVGGTGMASDAIYRVARPMELRHAVDEISSALRGRPPP